MNGSGAKLQLTEKQRWYIAGVRAGLSRRQAALAAGYAVASANNVAHNIERRGRGGNPTMRYFWNLLDSASGRNGSESKGLLSPQVQSDQ